MNKNVFKLTAITDSVIHLEVRCALRRLSKNDNLLRGV